MIASPNQSYLTPAEYLKYEQDSPVKHEYIDGKIYVMAGTTDTHNIIALNLATLIRNHLRGTNCRIFFADIKASIEAKNCFYYPDLLIICNPDDRETSTYKRFPKLIIEVLSSGTEAFDRGVDTPLPKGERILGSTTSLKLATLQLLAQRCDLPKRLRVCPTLVELLQVLFDWCKISTKGCLSSSSKYFTYCEVEARILQ